MASEPTIVYCVGATKAGTSWLYDYLRGHPQAYLRTVKEAHYFDAIETNSREWHQRWFARRRDGLVHRVRQGKLPELTEELQDYDAVCALHETPDYDRRAYRAYLMSPAGAAASIVADITPSYCTLSREMFKKMAQAALNTRFIYILRDPVARLWSHIRMNAARRAKSAEELAMRARRIFWRFGRGRHPGIWARSDYRGTLERLTSALAPNQLLVLFYEELFTQDAVALICTFLGIKHHEADFSRRVNEGQELAMDEDMLSHARGWLADQYAYVQQTIDHLPVAWQANMQRVPA